MKENIQCGTNVASAIESSPRLVSDLNNAVRMANVIGAAMNPPITFSRRFGDRVITITCAGGNSESVGKHHYNPKTETEYFCVKAVKAIIFDMLEEQCRPVHKTTIVVPLSEAVRIKQLLTTEPTCEEECMGEDECIRYTAAFDDGFQMDIKLCGVQYEEGETNAPYTEAVLFNKNGMEVSNTEACESFLGTWELESFGEKYIVEVVADNSK